MKTENTFTPTALPLFLTLSFPQPLVLFVLLVVLYLRCSSLCGLSVSFLSQFLLLVFISYAFLQCPLAYHRATFFSCRYSPFSPPIYCLSLLFHLLFLCSQLHLVFLLDYFFFLFHCCFRIFLLATYSIILSHIPLFISLSSISFLSSVSSCLSSSSNP